MNFNNFDFVVENVVTLDLSSAHVCHVVSVKLKQNKSPCLKIQHSPQIGLTVKSKAAFNLAFDLLCKAL